MTTVPPETVYENLSLLEEVDVVTSAVYRESAQEVLCDPEINFDLRQAIADRLNGANQVLGRATVVNNDSY